jgi:hypothetical protein
MSSWVVFSINLVLLVIVATVLWRYVERRTGERSALDEIKREVGAIITELNQTTERNIELVEDRMRRIREMVEAVDRRLGALKRHEDAQKHAELTYTKLRNARPAVAPEADGEAPEVHEGTTGDDGSTDAAGRERGEEERSEMTGGSEPVVSLRERVKTLYLQGLAPERIAAITGRTVGEVELMISLEEG